MLIYLSCVLVNVRCFVCSSALTSAAPQGAGPATPLGHLEAVWNSTHPRLPSEDRFLPIRLQNDVSFLTETTIVPTPTAGIKTPSLSTVDPIEQ